MPRWPYIFDPVQPDQITKAEEYAKRHGVEALRNPHALIGRTCGCGECFTCAAWKVWLRLSQHPHSDYSRAIIAKAEGK